MNGETEQEKQSRGLISTGPVSLCMKHFPLLEDIRLHLSDSNRENIAAFKTVLGL